MSAADYEPVIGLEVHVQLATTSKMFCGCEARFGAPPNTLVCPICTGQPGTLPSLNGEALRLGILAGLALDCTIDEVVRFDRKNYFYPDLPKSYQISQYKDPLCRDGHLTFEMPDGTTRDVDIVRAHLEEDSGKVIHPDGMPLSLVDLNRAGTPLLEIVTGPDLRSTTEAEIFLRTLRQTLRYAGVSNADMEKGALRVDVNISLRPVGTTELGTRTETKNLNSFRFVVGALTAEIARQSAILDDGGTVRQTTMAFNPDSGRTSIMRSKEDVHDYRYFPEPDLPHYDVPAESVEALRSELPEQPASRAHRYVHELGLKRAEAEGLVAEREISDYFEEMLDASTPPRLAAAWILNDLQGLANERKRPVRELHTTPPRLAGLLRLVDQDAISAQAAQTILAGLEDQPDKQAAVLAEELDLLQVSDGDELEQLVRDVLLRETELVARYRSGKTGVLNALLGSAMKASRGRANPNRVRLLLEQALS